MTKFDDKLKGLPPIYYLNMDHRTERKAHLENEFSKWDITCLLYTSDAADE